MKCIGYIENCTVISFLMNAYFNIDAIAWQIWTTFHSITSESWDVYVEVSHQKRVMETQKIKYTLIRKKAFTLAWDGFWLE